MWRKHHRSWNWECTNSNIKLGRISAKNNSAWQLKRPAEERQRRAERVRSNCNSAAGATGKCRVTDMPDCPWRSFDIPTFPATHKDLLIIPQKRSTQTQWGMPQREDDREVWLTKFMRLQPKLDHSSHPSSCHRQANRWSRPKRPHWKVDNRTRTRSIRRYYREVKKEYKKQILVKN